MKAKSALLSLILASAVLAPMGAVANDVITLYPSTQRFIGEVSSLDRDKYTTAHISVKGEYEPLERLKRKYNISSSYFGSRALSNPARFAKTGVIPAVKQKYTGVRSVDKYFVAGGTAGNLMYKKNFDYSTVDLSDYSKDLAKFVAQYYKSESERVPEYLEPFNEPMVHARDFVGKKDKTTAQRAQNIVEKICYYHRDLGQAVHAIPELKNMKVMGYASAFPEFESNDFNFWKTRYGLFMDIAGEDMDAFSIHLYDGAGINNAGGRRSGSNSEALLDMVETYSAKKFGVVKPIAITEFGRLVPNQPDWAAGNGVSNYNPVTNSQATRAQLHFLMNFMARENNIAVVIPFNTNRPAEPNYIYTKATLWVKEKDGSISESPRAYYYEMLKDLKGERVAFNSTNIDVQTQAFVSKNKMYVMLNNLDKATTLDLNLVGGGALKSVEVKSLKIFNDKLPELKITSYKKSPEALPIDFGETIVVTYEFKGAVKFDATMQSTKYYSPDILAPIKAGVDNKFSFSALDAKGAESAVLRLGVSRNHGESLAPAVSVNGQKIEYSGDVIRGYNQEGRAKFYGVLEIPVPASALKSGDNSVSVSFDKDGGTVATAILQVETKK